MTEDQGYYLARRIAEHAFTKKAMDVTLLHLKPMSTVTDYFVICHGESDMQVKAIADAIQDGMKKDGVRVWHVEGYNYLHWVLLDFVDVVVHVFQQEEREFYGLERLWGDAKIEKLTDE